MWMRTESWILLPKLAQEPRLCELPVPLHRVGRDMQCLGGLFHRQPAEETHLDHTTLSLIVPGQRLESLVQGDQIATRFVRKGQVVGQGDSNATGAAFLVTARAGEIDENPTHQT